jgi:hypothetical protein
VSRERRINHQLIAPIRGDKRRQTPRVRKGFPNNVQEENNRKNSNNPTNSRNSISISKTIWIITITTRHTV